MGADTQVNPDHLDTLRGPTFVALGLCVRRSGDRILLTGRTHEGKSVTLSLDAPTALLDCLVAAEMGRRILSDAGIDRRTACAALMHRTSDTSHFSGQSTGIRG